MFNILILIAAGIAAAAINKGYLKLDTIFGRKPLNDFEKHKYKVILSCNVKYFEQFLDPLTAKKAAIILTDEMQKRGLIDVKYEMLRRA